MARTRDLGKTPVREHWINKSRPQDEKSGLAERNH